MANPQESIKKYLINNGFLNKENNIDNANSTNVKGALINNKKMIEREENIKRIKILNIRKNEHFGDVFMFLNKKCPLWVRVKTKKADLLLLKKIDAIDISTNYQDIWKNIIKRPLANAKTITRLTFKLLTDFCNFYGIKTNLFKKRKKSFHYPNYYLRPTTTLNNNAIKKSKSYKIEIKSHNIKNLESNSNINLINKNKNDEDNKPDETSNKQTFGVSFPIKNDT